MPFRPETFRNNDVTIVTVAVDSSSYPCGSQAGSRIQTFGQNAR